MNSTKNCTSGQFARWAAGRVSHPQQRLSKTQAMLPVTQSAKYTGFFS